MSTAQQADVENQFFTNCTRAKSGRREKEKVRDKGRHDEDAVTACASFGNGEGASHAALREERGNERKLECSAQAKKERTASTSCKAW